MNISKKTQRIKLKTLIFFLIFINIFLSAWYVLNKDIVFHTDIARDFLVLQDIVKTHKPTLIGPRSGGISGVFHGPLWFYISLLPFILGKGNPVVTGWFWVFLSGLSIWTTYNWGKKLFNKNTALLAALLLSVFSIAYTNALFNPFGAVIIFPIFFYMFGEYLKSTKVFYLISALFILGLIVQFQIAFGVPILVLITLYTIPLLVKRKKLFHMFSYLILLIPFSTYILFELRHNFLQIRSVINYLTIKQSAGELGFLQVVLFRIKGAFFDGLNIIPQNGWFALPITLLFGFVLYKLKKGDLKHKDNYFLFFYLYFGYWILTLAYKGVVWGYYYWPFLPLILLIFSSTIEFIDKRVFFVIFLYVFMTNFYFGVQSVKSPGFGWRFYYNLAKNIYKDANGNEFGYYVYTPDQFGYSEKYALSYTQQEYANTKSFPYQKKHLTYLTTAPAPDDKPWLNGDWWKKNQVAIAKKPDFIFKFPNRNIVEKYWLTEGEIKIPSDPNLIQDLTFR